MRYDAHVHTHPTPSSRFAAHFPWFTPTALLALLAMPLACAAASAAASAATAVTTQPSAATTTPAAAPLPAPIDAHEVIVLLDRTIQWYRTRGAGRNIATQPSDWLIVSENDRTARQILSMAFAIARADAQMIARAGSRTAAAAGTPATGLFHLKAKLTDDQKSIDAELAVTRRDLGNARGKQRAALTAKLSELQGERDLTDARLSIIDTMADFVETSGAFGAGSNSLKMQIDAMALALPGVETAATAAAPTSATAAIAKESAVEAQPAPALVSADGGLWQLAHNVVRLAARKGDIEAQDRAAAVVQDAFIQARAPLIARVKSLAARGDELAALADNADAPALNGMRGQLDALASKFRQMSTLLIPFGKANVLFIQYRANLRSWRDAANRQYRDALSALAVRLGILLFVLAIVFAAAEFWKRAVFRYSHDARRRHQLLLFRDIALWSLVMLIIGIAFASEIGSIATLAGLITAGIAVAMQSVLVSIVGYFFLIGKYGIRVGDRVQIGDVTGEVIDIGLVRMHLMELGGQGKLGPTGRVVGFANSIVFQVSSGLFKQIPGIDMAWHEIKLTLPADADPVAAKARLLEAVNDALRDYRGEIDRQAAEIQAATASKSDGGAEPAVQLHFGPAAVEALVRYPVHLPQAAEIDERVSEELIRALGGRSAGIQSPRSDSPG